MVHAGQWDPDDPWVVEGNDPGLSSSFRVWGYDTCWGSMAQFTKVQAHQCLPKADRLTWEEAAAPTLTGSTAYRMLHGWAPNTVKPGDVVLVWGGGGGLGSLAIQMVALAGGRAVAVVSSDERGEYCKALGAIGYINRRDYSHWGVPPAWDSPDWKAWLDGAKAFGKAIWDVVGEKTNPKIVFEHPGQDTIPTSNFVCDRGGMIVICAGTSGYDTLIDVRYLWYLQKRYQGSHLFNDEQAAAFNELVARREDPNDPGPHLRIRRGRPRASADGRREAPRGERRGADQRAGARSRGSGVRTKPIRGPAPARRGRLPCPSDERTRSGFRVSRASELRRSAGLPHR